MAPLRGPAGTQPRSADEMMESLVAGTFAKKSALITADLARETHIALACMVRGTDSIAAFNDTLTRLRKDVRMVPWNQYGETTSYRLLMIALLVPPLLISLPVQASSRACVAWLRPGRAPLH